METEQAKFIPTANKKKDEMGYLNSEIMDGLRLGRLASHCMICSQAQTQEPSWSNFCRRVQNPSFNPQIIRSNDLRIEMGSLHN